MTGERAVEIALALIDDCNCNSTMIKVRKFTMAAAYCPLIFDIFLISLQ